MRLWLKITIASGIIIILGVIVYVFFPKIWGSVAYPLDYEQYIAKYAQQYNVDPYFAAAVIYTESRFNADSVSRVGASGLMQIMPSTAAGIAERIGDSKVGDLFDPETSIRYGIYYLREKLDMYNNDYKAVLTAYNAGGSVADRYLISRDIVLPNETVGFIKTVTNAEEMYREIYPNAFTTEKIAEKMRLQQQPTLLQRILSFFK
ncbi:MAG: lytic transglycosylase domain-containing protein [Patescibacteria group bacterium]|nr:lytic transglycosylase domain-containing protein [Patescibacteria group bacterium]